MLVGVDIGGTFTDFVLNADGTLRVHKRFSTPHDPAQAMLAGLDWLIANHADEDTGARQISHVIHGSTVATNTILERKGAKTALITTAGFRDILTIGRQNRPDSELYALQPKLPIPLVQPHHCYEVSERLDHAGEVITPLDLAALDNVLDEIAAQGIEAIAVCFLYSYLNPTHEYAVRERILQRGMWAQAQIALSCEVRPEFREYERASTVTLEAYVRPKVSRYLQNLERELPAECTLRVMKSDGGIVSAERASQQAIQTALSGPAAGVIGAFHIAKLAGYDQIITLDMGGTSTDVALSPGAPIRHPEREIDGLPLRTPTLDIETVGAGGGSIARLDAGGALRVGPESAGADPGSIIYGRGGQRLTISDANAVLGRLDPDHFLGGGVKLDIDSAVAAMEALAGAMHLSAEAAATGIVHIGNVKIAQAVRRVSIARGYDPRQFTLVAFGGAGPLHACEVAAMLDIPHILIPRYPGAMCALGLLTADVVLDYSHPALGILPTNGQLKSRIDAMTEQARRDLAQENIPASAMQFNPMADLRYKGQAYELTVPFGADLVSAFHQAHTRRYGYAMPGRSVEVVNLHLQAVGVVEKPTFAPESITQNDGKSGFIGVKGQLAQYEREALQPGACFHGPALIFQLDSTVYVAVGWSANVDGYRNLILSRN
jgi:N-methylhydantoinase A